MSEKSRPVIVTTEFRGLFFGYATDTSSDVIKLEKARNCLYWSKSIGGFMGLASVGPDNQCRIGISADIELRKVTAVLECTEEAVKRWEAAPAVS